KNYTGPAMIHGDTVLQGQGACDIWTGAQKMRVDPITGLETPWKWTRNYGCNTPAASEHLLTFRSGAAGFFDLCNDGGTGNIGGFRSSCTNNLVVAGGLLTVPEYTRTCTCAYQNQTSVGLVHMPEAELWTFFGTKEAKGPVRRLGVNFGAPGDRRAGDGTLFIEFPATAGTSPAVDIETKPAKPEQFRRHPAVVEGPNSWIGASGFRGVDEIALWLDDEPGPRKFNVRLYFMEPDDVAPGQRLFHLSIQGKEMLRDFDICREAGGPLRTLCKEFRGILADQALRIRLAPADSSAVRSTLLSGIEIVAED
ncbi:MAG: malectin, partial [Gemmataceae bacterium]|nr:malectin [Gemmataceae bacterium]